MIHSLRRGVLVFVLVVCASATVLAVPITYYGIDAGAGPSSPRPNSDATAATFDAAASALGTVSIVDFESAPLGYFASVTVAPGVTASMSGMANDFSCGITTDTGDNIVGYNTTAGGARHVRAVPTYGIGTCTLAFAFDDPINSWGAYITGLGTAAGDLHIVYDDGTVQDHAVSGNSSGGSIFFGLTDAGKQFSQVALELRGVTSTSRDNYSVDDMRYVGTGEPAIPEPTTLALLGLGLLGVVRKRRK